MKAPDTIQSAINLMNLEPCDIPVFHEVALRLLQMMNDNSYIVEEVNKLINEDTALASEMLRHANSTYFTGKAQISGWCGHLQCFTIMKVALVVSV